MVANPVCTMKRLSVVMLAMFAATSAEAWVTVVNNGDLAPGSDTKYFFSYNQPSINDSGQVVFRARAKPASGSGGGSQGEPLSGIFTRDMSVAGAPINALALTGR